MKQHFFKLMFLVTILAISLESMAQVTIGTEEPPIDGALLQLKNISDKGSDTNATMGLGLPRVQLSIVNDLDNVLSPAEKAADSNYKINHLGLVVYNPQKSMSSPVICQGVYVWDGDKWQPLSQPKSKSDITVIDNDGNAYNAKWFAYDPCDPNIGAYWTTSNLYTTKDKSGAAFSGGVRLNPGYTNRSSGEVSINSVTNLTSGTIAANTYGVAPTNNVKNNSTRSYQDFAKEYGLLYNFNQAKVACPVGWHLPDVNDWNNLIINYGGGYSTFGAKMRKSSVWKHYYTTADTSPQSFQWGLEDGAVQPEPSEFNAVPSGYVGSNGAANYFGQAVYWWKSDGGACFSSYATAGAGNNASSDLNSYNSVRCVKD